MRKRIDGKVLPTILCLVFGLGVSTRAQGMDGGEATLSGYLDYAALNNPGLQAAFNRWQAEVERVETVDALPNPKLSYGYFLEEVETRVGPQTYKVGVSQAFPWFGTLKLRGGVATEAANAAFERFQAAQLKLFFEVKKSYFEYSYLHRAISITEDNVQLLKHLEGVARSKHRAGASQSGVIKAQVELGKLDDRLRSLRDLRGPMMARLNAALNRPHDTPLPWPTNPTFSVVEIREVDMFDLLASRNPELKIADALIRKGEQGLALARKAYYPGITLGVEYMDTDESLMPGTSDSGKDPVIAMVALDIPIWGGKNRAGVQEAQLRQLSAELDRDQKENLLQSDLKMALFTFRDAERKIDLYGDTLVPQAGQALKVSEEAYRAGSMDFLNLIDAERLLLEFQLAHERALADREIALAEIERLVGKPLAFQPTEQGRSRHEN